MEINIFIEILILGFILNKLKLNPSKKQKNWRIRRKCKASMKQEFRNMESAPVLQAIVGIATILWHFYIELADYSLN